MGVESDFQDNLSHERNSELYSIYVIQAGSSFRKVLSFVKIKWSFDALFMFLGSYNMYVQ